jgi:hypothetical protein
MTAVASIQLNAAGSQLRAVLIDATSRIAPAVHRGEVKAELREPYEEQAPRDGSRVERVVPGPG